MVSWRGQRTALQPVTGAKRLLAFTLVELLVVITIIVILSGVGMVIFTRVQKKGRDAQRRADLRKLQEAVEQYYADNSRYPSTCSGGTPTCAYPNSSWWGQCSSYGGRTATCGDSNVFITGICPTYIEVLPKDPKADAEGSDCYLYRSTGTDYMILAHLTMETVDVDPGPNDEMDWPCCEQPTIAVYSPGARRW